MREAIAVLNAGSSSLKFSLFELVDEGLALVARGPAENLPSCAVFTARDAHGTTIASHAWPAGEPVGTRRGGLDALVFTGGIGEHAGPVRARILEGIEWLGFTLDPAANARNAMRITTPDSAKPSYVISTNEELVIARHTRAMIDR